MHTEVCPNTAMGDPFRVDVPTKRHPGVLCTPRLLRGDRVAVKCGSTARSKEP
jgi:hypothetical protein